MTNSGEAKLLGKYRTRLAKAEAELERFQDLQREVKGLRQMVAGLETLVGDEPDGPTAPALPPPPARSGLRNGSGLSLAAFLRTLYSDGQPRRVSDVMDLLRTSPQFVGRMPTHNSVGNRHQDLRKAGYLRQVSRGQYQLASAANGASPENDLRREGPNLADQLQVHSPPPGAS
jgi:hypothetical protein